MEDEKKRRLSNILWALFGVLFIVAIFLIYYFTSAAYIVTKLSSNDVRVRRWCADELVRIGESSGKPALAVALDPNAEVEARRLALFVLGEIQYKEAIPQLVALLKGDNETFREQSAYAIGRIGDASVAPELLKAYETAQKGEKMKIIGALGDLDSADGKALLKREAETNQDETIKGAAEYALKNKPPVQRGGDSSQK